MRVYLFTDLDDTLFQTLRKCGVPPDTRQELSAAAWSRDGEPLSFMTPQQRRLVGLFADARIIPVTARNLDAFRRVRLPFPHGAVLNYGGTVLLPDGSVDTGWQGQMVASLAPFQRRLQDGAAYLARLAESEGVPVRVRRIGTDTGDFYIVIKNTQFPQSPQFPQPTQDTQHTPPTHCFLERMRREGEAFFNDSVGWRVHQNDNNLAFIPAVLNKSHAVRHMVETHIAPLGEEFMTIGMGDSLVDLDFMNACQYAIVPSGSQIQKARLHG